MTNFVAGSAAATLATVATYPLDVIRTRMVSQGEPKVRFFFLSTIRRSWLGGKQKRNCVYVSLSLATFRCAITSQPLLKFFVPWLWAALFARLRFDSGVSACWSCCFDADTKGGIPWPVPG